MADVNVVITTEPPVNVTVDPPLIHTVTVAPPPVYAITVGYNRGPPGPAGEGQTVVTSIAGEAISGHRAVRIVNGIAWLADSSDLAQIGQVSGISSTAAIVGTSIDIQVGGEMTEPTWAFNPGRIWVGTNGLLTQTPPAVGFQQVIAQAISATRIIINIDSPLVLGA